MEVFRSIRNNNDFDLNNTAPSSPLHYSSPSTPKRFGEYYISAPSSPSQLTHFYRDFNDLLLSPSPLDQRKPDNPLYEAEFAFDVSDDFRNQHVSADELFHGGVIKPMQLSPSPVTSREHRSTISRSKDYLAGALSPRNKKDSSLLRDSDNAKKKDKQSPEHDRGRERTPLISSSSRRAARSLSPVRVSQYQWEDERCQQQQQQIKEQSSSFTKPISLISDNNKSHLSNSASKGSRKWRLKDLFLFRSASEGRAAAKDPLRKYTAVFRRGDDVKGGSSTKNVESPGSGSGSKRRGKVSAHELHYTANRAVSEDLKKKTFLPYKQGILGRLAFNPAGHVVGNGFGLSRK